MKKILTLLLTLTFIFAITSCGSDSPDSSKSKIYKKGYQDTMDNMSAIIAQYWQDGGETSKFVGGLKGTTEEVYNAVNILDPELFDAVSDTVAFEYGDNPLEQHILKTGVDLFFSDSELGKGLRDTAETLFLGLIEKSLAKDDETRKDELQFCGGNLNYAVARTTGTVSELLEQLDKDSGYYMAVTAIDNYYKEIYDLFEKNHTEDMNSVMNNKEGAEEIQEKWDYLLGIMDALKDSKQDWNDKKEEWINEFFSCLELEKSDLTDDDMKKKVYCIIDKDGNQHGIFLSSDIEDYIQGHIEVFNDGTCSFIEKTNEGNIRRVVDKSGHEIYVGKDYYDLTPSGNILRKSTENNFDYGDYDILEIVHPDGTAKEILRGFNIKPSAYIVSQEASENEFSYCSGYGNKHWMAAYHDGARKYSDLWEVTYESLEEKKSIDVIIDMKSEKLVDEPEVNAEKNTQSNNVAINKQYSLDTSTWNMVDINNPNSAVTSFEAGQGLSRLFYNEANQQYWAVSNSGYYYILDKDFRRIHEPTQLTKSLWDITPYGMILNEDGGNMGLYGADGTQLCVFPARAVIGFIGDIKTSVMNSSVDINKSKCFNLNTKQQMYLQLSEKIPNVAEGEENN